MHDLIRLGNRGKQVLQALHSHGPLSTHTLMEIISPRISRIKLNESIQRLNKAGLVINRYSSIQEKSRRYIQLSSSKSAKVFLSNIFNVSKAVLKRTKGASNEIEHAQECVIWANRFQMLCPDAHIVRDYEISRYTEIRNILLQDPNDDVRLLPDLVLRVRNFSKTGFVNIAIEIERTIKSRGRLTEKLRKFAIQSKVDGVIYICRSEQVSRALYNVYKDRVLANSLRVKHYGLNFLMFSKNEFVPSANDFPMLNQEQKNISFNRWISFLRTIEDLDRRDSNENSPDTAIRSKI